MCCHIPNLVAFLACRVVALCAAGQTNMEDYWILVRKLVSGKRRALDSCITLVSWMIWKERNNKVFNNEATTLDHLLERIQDEFS